MYVKYDVANSPDGEKNRDFQNVFLAKLGLLTHFVACAKGQTAKI